MQRDLITGELDHSMLVEAGAGSGKTKSLVDRMVALVATDTCRVETMAAVTFTRKAAAELQRRFQNELEVAFREETDPKKKGRFEQALQRLDHLFAGTIHSFCSRLLRERPIEAGLDPDFEELEEFEGQILRERCWSEYLDELHVTDSPHLKTLYELGLSDPNALFSTYQKICLYPEVEMVRTKQDRPNFTAEKKRLNEYLNRVFTILPSTVPEKGWDKLQSALLHAFYQRKFLDLTKDSDFIAVLRVLDKRGKATYNRWPDKDVAKLEEAHFARFKEGVVSPCLEQWRRYCHYFIMECLLPAVAYFQRVREKQSLMDFQDLLLRAAELLREHPKVREYFQRRFTHILVDEFQDTDPIQAEILILLTGADTAERSWIKQSVKPGRLFIVGDPKQSIYRFRRADIDTYNQVKDIIIHSGGQIVRLTTNFRSLPSVCHWINPIFQKSFPDTGNRFQPAFEHLKPFHEEVSGGIRRITIQKVERHSPKEIARKDAIWISSWITQALDGRAREIDGKVRPQDIMILLKYRANLHYYARELEARGIPYEISGGGAFSESEELRELLNILISVAEPDDQISLVATLRGQFFGVNDDMLYRFRDAGGYFSYLSSRDFCTDIEAGQSVGDALEQMREFHSWSQKQPAGVVLSRIIDRLGILPLALTREMGDSRAGNLLKSLELILTDSSGTVLSFQDMVTRLKEYYEELEVEEMSIEPGKEDAVRIMNLHKAKGLEARIVFLADPLQDVSHEPEIHIAREGEQATGYVLASQQKGEFQSEVIGIPPRWSEVKVIEETYRKAEEDRLLYVAATRARELLIVSTYLEKEGTGAWKDLTPHLQDVDVLEFPEEVIPASAEKIIKPEAFTIGKKEIAARVRKSGEKSYRIESVTKVVHSREKREGIYNESGRGMSWGTVIHRILEAVARDEAVSLEILAENILKEENRPLSDITDAIAQVKGMMSSELWHRMKEAERALFEVPFMLEMKEGGIPCIMTGAIDLAFKEPDGWVIVDYKTDTVVGNLESLVAYYRPQIEHYCRFWEQMSGETVKEAGLYFIGERLWARV